MVYRDGKRGNYMVKRFPVLGVTRDKEYVITRGSDDSKVYYFSANPNGEAEVIKVFLRPNPKLKIASFEYDFSELTIRGRGSYGNILTKKPVKNIVKKEEGVSTLGARDIWFDDTVKRLNVAERGRYLGAFMGEDKILTINASGYYRHYNFDLANHFDEDMVLIEKFDPEKIMTAAYFDADQGYVYLKRFNFEESDRKIRFIGDNPESKLLAFSLDYLPVLQINYDEKANGREIEALTLETTDFIAVKSYRARGKRLSKNTIRTVQFLDPLPFESEVADDEAKLIDTEAPQENEDKSDAKEDQPKAKTEKKKKQENKEKDEDKQIRLDL
jgi:topoisomerase-4 subunit A